LVKILRSKLILVVVASATKLKAWHQIHPGIMYSCCQLSNKTSVIIADIANVSSLMQMYLIAFVEEETEVCENDPQLLPAA